MKRLKKVFAVLLTLAMVLGMSITTFAAGSATITVNNLPEGKNIALKYVQVIIADQTTSTGWAFTSNQIQAIYINAFNGEGTDINATDEAATDRNSEVAQNVIKELIKIEKGEVSGTTGTNSSEIAQALSDVRNNVTLGKMENGETVTEAGVYVIVAEEQLSENEKMEYTFNTMAAYVGFGEVKDENGNVVKYPVLQNTTIDAKKSEITFDKDEADDDDVVGIGDVVDFTIKVNVPYIEPGSLTDKTFVVRDAVTGGVYEKLEDATIMMGAEDLKTSKEDNGYGVTIDATDDNASFEIDLGDLINTANTNAGREITVSYQVKITGTNVIKNKAYAGHESELYDNATYGSDEEKLFTGIINITKTGDQDVRLANAGFEVVLNNETLYFTKSETGVYEKIKADDVPNSVKSTLESELEASSNDVIYVKQVFTKEDGTIVLKGLDVGTYKIIEKTAPEGYSINEKIPDVELSVPEVDGEASKIEEGTGYKVALANITADSPVSDTKLSALPSTGGIGTTIFTIGGCAIIIVAAGLFFASRKKAAK